MAPALWAIRLAGRIVAVIAGTVGVTYAVASVIGPHVLWLVDSPAQPSWSIVTLPLPWRIAHAAAIALGAATVAVIAMLVSDLSGRIRREVRFVPVVTRRVWGIAVALAAGSWLTSIAANLAGHAALIYPDDGALNTADLDNLPIDWAVTAGTFSPDLAMLGLAVTLALLAWIIRAGERLQRDTEGLV